MTPKPLTLAALLLFFSFVTDAAEIVWTNLSGGSWSTAVNWSPNQVPSGTDNAYLTNTGTFTVTLSASATVNNLSLGFAGSSGIRTLQITAGTLTATNLTAATNSVINIAGGTLRTLGFNSAGAIYHNSGTWQLLAAANLNVYNFTNGDLRGGILTVTNCAWVNGNMNADTNGDKTIIPPGGVLNFLGAATRYFSYNSPATAGRGFDNYGTWNWSGDATLYGLQAACVVNNYGTVNQTGPGDSYFAYYPGYGAPVWNNFGTFTKSGGSNSFYWYGVYANNSGVMNVQSGKLSSYSSTVTNNASLTVGANGLLLTEGSGWWTLNPASSLTSSSMDAIRVNSGNFYVQTTNVIAPSIWIAGGTLWHQTNNLVPTINESAGTWRLTGAVAVNNYNLTNGELRGGTLTVTNFNWFNGPMHADATGDKTIIPVGGVLNMFSTASRTMSYYGGVRGRDLDNFGTWNWLDNSILSGNGSIVNNYGTVNVSGSGTSATYAQFVNNGTSPTWNNLGTFTKTPGTNLFYFSGCYLNNSGAINFQSGDLWLTTSTVNNTGSLLVQNGLLESSASTATNYATITLSGSSVFQVDAGGTFTFAPASSLTVPGVDRIRLNSGTTFLQTTNVSAPSIWIAGGTLWHQTNNAVPTINESAGTWRLSGNVAVNNYNLTNGELRGGTLTVTNFNWFNGPMHADATGDKTIIPVGGVMNVISTAARTMSYYGGVRGRDLDNFGTWNWLDNSVLSGNGSIVNNYGTVNVSGSGTSATYAQFVNNGTSPTWNNPGTFTKTPGTNLFYFSGCYLNNSGAISFQSGDLWLTTSTVNNTGSIFVQNGLLDSSASIVTNYATITLSGSSVFQMDSGGTFTFAPASSLTVPGVDRIRLNSGTTFLQTTNVSAPSIWIAGGTLWHQTNNVVPTINESAGTWRLSVATAVNNYNLTNGELRGGILTVTNMNWLNGNLNADANSDKTIIPVGGVLNLSSSATRYLSYYAPATAGRTLDNFGVCNWSGDCVFYGVGAAIVNNYGAVNITGTGTPQFAFHSSASPTWNNFGTLTKSTGTNYFYFNSVYVNNTNSINVQSGSLSIYGSTFTNLGSVTLQPSTLLYNEQGATTVLQPNSVISGPSPNSFRITSGSVYVRSAALSIPSLWLSGGTLFQETNSSVSEINQSGGTWRLNVAATAANYNLTNGELRGANLTLNNFNWLGGNLNSDGPGNDTVTVNSTLSISGNTAKTMSYYTQPGRSLINNGTGTWGGVGITAQGAATFRNNSSLSVTGDVAFVWGGSGAVSVFHNLGTYTKSSGTGTATFGSTTITNSGTFDFNVGSFSFSGPFVQTAGSSFLGTNFTAGSSVRVEAGTLTGRGSVAGAFYNNGVVNPGASPGLITGSTYTNSAAGTLNIELGGATGAGTNYDQIRLSGAATLNGTLNVTLANNFAPGLSNSFTVMTFGSRSGIFPTLIPPAGVTLDAAYSSTNLVLTVTALTNVPLQITSFPSNQTVFQSDPASFFVGVSGVTPITYQWQFNGTNINGATNATFNLPATGLNNAGPYTVLVTDATAATTNATATLTVIPFDGTIAWTNTAGGSWSVAANWLPNRVPGPTNTASITIAGTYTVSINSSATISNLVVGANSGTQTLNLASGQILTLGRNSYFATNTVLGLDGTFQTSGGSNYFGGLVNWYVGVLSGPGRTVVGTNGNLYCIGSQQQKHIISNVLENYGQITTSPDAGIGPGQLLRFSGGSHLTNHPSGVINIGANALEYASSQIPRSYLVNFGTLVTASSIASSPSYISIDFLNYGLLDNYGYVYISRGANYGEFRNYNGLSEFSIFGDPTTGEYFSFEPGTQLTGPQPNIACGGPVQWKAGNTVHRGRLSIAQGSGGATSANAEFKVLANYTNTFQVSILRGAFTAADPNVITDLRSFSDGFVSFWSFGITNAGKMYIDTLSHVIYGFGNGGTLVIRTNGGFSGGSVYGGGRVIITNNATATFSGTAMDAQFIENFGSTIVTGSTPMTGNTYFENKPGATVYFGGGSFNAGPASLANFGAMNGFGGMSISVTNYNTVTADDSLVRTLALGNYYQISGETRLRGGNFSGAINLLGGTLDGAGSVGSVLNNASVLPGLPIGGISANGGYTNETGGIFHMQIGATNNYDRINVAGFAKLSGTLNVTFTNGFYPITGNTFTAMTYTARSGQFDQILLPSYEFEVIYTPTNLLLRASNSLPFLTLSVAAGSSTQCVCQPFSILASASDLDGTITNITVDLNGSTFASVNGAAIQTAAEMDFPSALQFIARAWDDRGASRSVTQDVALVTGPLHSLILGGVRTNTFKMCMLGETGRDYSVLGNTNLTTTNWIVVGTMERTNGIWRYFDTQFTNFNMRYYRARQIP